MAGTIRWTDTTSGRTTSVRTNTAGHYTTDLAPGAYRVSGGNGAGWPNGSCQSLVDWATGPTTAQGVRRPEALPNPVALTASGPSQTIYVACEAM